MDLQLDEIHPCGDYIYDLKLRLGQCHFSVNETTQEMVYKYAVYAKHSITSLYKVHMYKNHAVVSLKHTVKMSNPSNTVRNSFNESGTNIAI